MPIGTLDGVGKGELDAHGARADDDRGRRRRLDLADVDARLELGLLLVIVEAQLRVEHAVAPRLHAHPTPLVSASLTCERPNRRYMPCWLSARWPRCVCVASSPPAALPATPSTRALPSPKTRSINSVQYRSLKHERKRNLLPLVICTFSFVAVLIKDTMNE